MPDQTALLQIWMLWPLEFGKDFIKTLLGMGLIAAEFEDYILSLKINPPV